MRDRTIGAGWLETGFRNLTLISASLPVCKLRFLLVATNTLLCLPTHKISLMKTNSEKQYHRDQMQDIKNLYSCYTFDLNA
jgi:hypothetical protein